MLWLFCARLVSVLGLGIALRQVQMLNPSALTFLHWLTYTGNKTLIATACPIPEKQGFNRLRRRPRSPVIGIQSKMQAAKKSIHKYNRVYLDIVVLQFVCWLVGRHNPQEVTHLHPSSEHFHWSTCTLNCSKPDASWGTSSQDTSGSASRTLPPPEDSFLGQCNPSNMKPNQPERQSCFFPCSRSQRHRARPLYRWP